MSHSTTSHQSLGHMTVRLPLRNLSIATLAEACTATELIQGNLSHAVDTHRPIPPIVCTTVVAALCLFRLFTPCPLGLNSARLWSSIMARQEDVRWIRSGFCKGDVLHDGIVIAFGQGWSMLACLLSGLIKTKLGLAIPSPHRLSSQISAANHVCGDGG